MQQRELATRVHLNERDGSIYVNLNFTKGALTSHESNNAFNAILMYQYYQDKSESNPDLKSVSPPVRQLLNQNCKQCIIIHCTL